MGGGVASLQRFFGGYIYFKNKVLKINCLYHFSCYSILKSQPPSKNRVSVLYLSTTEEHITKPLLKETIKKQRKFFLT